MRTFGECSVNIGGKQRVLRGEAEIHAAGLETEIEGNMDGSIHQTAKTKACTLKLSLEQDEDIEITAREMIEPRDVVFVEEMNGRTHFFGKAKIKGDVGYNPSTGALSGFEYACARADYKSRKRR